MSPLSHALSFLARSLFDLAIFGFLLRFIFQLIRADFFNPVSQMILKITNPVLIPLRRILPSIRGIDTACLLIIILLTALKLLTVFWLQYQKAPSLSGLSLWTLGDISTATIYFFFFAIIIQAVMSWVNPGQPYNPLNKLLTQITAPLMRPVRRVVPPIGGFDITPIPVIIGLQLLIILLATPLVEMGLLLATK